MLLLVTKTGNEATILESEVVLLSISMPHLATTTLSQEIPATPVTAQTLLLLTSTPKFDKTTTLTVSELQLSSTSHNQPTVKLPSRAPSNAEAFPHAAEV